MVLRRVVNLMSMGAGTRGKLWRWVTVGCRSAGGVEDMGTLRVNPRHRMKREIWERGKGNHSGLEEKDWGGSSKRDCRGSLGERILGTGVKRETI